ncbi:MAG: hypothetical protein M0Q26_08480 [Chitinophagaceae bacterium]|nr:hypothetical protein [Chitinophagaceae bacterium]
MSSIQSDITLIKSVLPTNTHGSIPFYPLPGGLFDNLIHRIRFLPGYKINLILSPLGKLPVIIVRFIKD